MFRDRNDAGVRLARRLAGRELERPVVLAIPCGGLVIGAILARELVADLDVVLSRKLRAPGQPQLALGAVSECGEAYLNHFARQVDVTQHYLMREQRHQLAEIARYQGLFRSVRSQAWLTGRSVILTDDSMATGSTMIAALAAVKARQPREIIVAVPVASMESAQALEEIRARCADVVCLHHSPRFWGIEEYYVDFSPVSDEQAVELLREFQAIPCAAVEG